ncbi:DUF1641 domain-containing protein [Pseudogracilibacillus sp. ICA-222130]|uniref:DUF1641 domain-containing protein n=1 Tax=Pseudogracilibacillus sp. ICA-222130 TaxID=3134655 RepID=UPI0030BEC28C
MAEPIREIHRPTITKEQQIDAKLDHLKEKFANNEESLDQLLDIVGELGTIGALEALKAMLLAKEDIAKIGLEQVTKEPVTNLLNTIIGATGAMMEADPDQTKNVVHGVVSGLKEGHEFVDTEQKIKLFDLMRSLSDPDINRAVGFGLHFLKGMGKELKE